MIGVLDLWRCTLYRYLHGVLPIHVQGKHKIRKFKFEMEMPLRLLLSKQFSKTIVKTLQKDVECLVLDLVDVAVDVLRNS